MFHVEHHFSVEIGLEPADCSMWNIYHSLGIIGAKVRTPKWEE